MTRLGLFMAPTALELRTIIRSDFGLLDRCEVREAEGVGSASSGFVVEVWHGYGDSLPALASEIKAHLLNRLPVGFAVRVKVHTKE